MTKAVAAMSLVGGAVTASTYLADGRIAAQALRYLGTAAALLALAGIRGRGPGSWRLRRPVGAEWWWLAAAATSGLTLYNLALIESLGHAEAPLVASIVAGVPLALALVAPLTAGRPVAHRTVVGAALILAGSVLMYGTGRSDLAGVVLAVVALAGECGFTLLSGPVLGRLGPVSIATHTAWMAAVQLCVLAVVSGDTNLAPQWGRPAALAMLYLIGASVVAFVLWFDAVGAIGAATAGLAAGVIPVVALLTGLPFGVATITSTTLAGVGVVAAGIAFGVVRRPVRVPVGAR